MVGSDRQITSSGMTAFLLLNSNMFVSATRSLSFIISRMNKEFIPVEKFGELVDEQEPKGSKQLGQGLAAKSVWKL